jgi:hypothetical protein
MTLLTLKDLAEECAAEAYSVFNWARTHMLAEKGYFYYQILPSCRNKIPYMRWSQAWMLMTLSTLLESHADSNDGTDRGVCSDERSQLV